MLSYNKIRNTLKIGFNLFFIKQKYKMTSFISLKELFKKERNNVYALRQT